MAKNNAKLIDVSTYIQAGINPKNGLPLRVSDDSKLYKEIRKLIRIKDEQSAVNRYKWNSTHLSLTSSDIERFFYYKFTLAYFRLEDRFYLMPFALDGGIDFYGRENKIHPIPYADDDSESTRKQKELLSTIKLDVIKDAGDGLLADKLKSAVIIRDYTPQSDIQHAIPRATLQDSIIGFESELLPYMRTAIINSTGVTGVRASDSDEAEDIIEASNSVRQAALEGQAWIPILQKMDRTPLTNQGNFMAQNYLMAIQGVDNLRESFYGTAKKGLYTKAEHTNDSENSMDNPLSSPLIDGLNLRKHACEIINSIWNIGISVEINDELEEPIEVEGIKEGGNENEPDTKDKSTYFS